MNVDPNEARSLILRELANLGLKDVRLVPQGQQNYVYACLLHGKTKIVKVADARHRSLEALQIQSEMLRELNTYCSAICAPVDIKDGLTIAELEIRGITFYAIAYPFAKGTAVDIKNPKHTRLMGKSLALLHKAMRKLRYYPIGKIAETATRLKIRQVAREQGAEAIHNNASKHFETSKTQLLHGDFSAGNLKISGKNMSIFDFDNCTYGTTTYELADALYMVLFDQITRGEFSVYKEFRRVFLEAYLTTSETYPDIQVIEDLVGYRVLILASWLRRPSDAPLFIRQSSQAWLDTLGHFVEIYFEKIVLPGQKRKHYLT